MLYTAYPIDEKPAANGHPRQQQPSSIPPAPRHLVSILIQIYLETYIITIKPAKPRSPLIADTMGNTLVKRQAKLLHLGIRASKIV